MLSVLRNAARYSRYCGLLILSSVALSAQGAAPKIPAIEEICSGEARSHPEWVKVRESLVADRSELHERVIRHNDRCPGDMSSTSPDYPACVQEKASLQAAQQEHIARTRAFNDSVKAACYPALEAGKGLPEAWLQQFKNVDLRNWLRANVVCGRQLLADDFGISADDQLKITPERFNTLDPSVRINLLAFELGKVFYRKVVETSPSRMQISEDFSSDTIDEMAHASYRGLSLRGQTPESLRLGDPPGEGSSGFGYVFRAELLGISGADWKQTQAKFHAIVDPVVKAAKQESNP